VYIIINTLVYVCRLLCFFVFFSSHLTAVDVAGVIFSVWCLSKQPDCHHIGINCCAIIVDYQFAKMENSSHNYVRIENAKFGNRGIIYTGSVFAISFIICAIIGATGPEVIQIRNDGISTLRMGDNGIAQWNGVLEEMTPLNQLFWLSARVYRNSDENTDEEVGEVETW
jgi:hypothetical protein